MRKSYRNIVIFLIIVFIISILTIITQIPSFFKLIVIPVAYFEYKVISSLIPGLEKLTIDEDEKDRLHKIKIDELEKRKEELREDVETLKKDAENLK